MHNDLTGVILAAGMGTRLGQMTKSTPKPLIKVGEKALIEYPINWLKYLDVSKIVVVGGYMFDTLREFIKKLDPSIGIVKNEDYAKTHRMVSLMKTRNELVGDLIFLDADYIFHKLAADEARVNFGEEVTLFATTAKSKYSLQDGIAETDDENNLINIFKTDDVKELEKNEYYPTSLTYCPAAKIDSFFAIAAAAMQSMGNGWMHTEDALLEFAKGGNQVKVANISKPLWIEVDKPDELEMARKFLLEYQNFIP